MYDFDDDLEAPEELSVEDIVREARRVPHDPELPPGTPETIRGTGADGHSYTYRVVGVYSDGTPRTSQYDAQHNDDCLCSDPERWY